jgi:hypothetical protein
MHETMSNGRNERAAQAWRWARGGVTLLLVAGLLGGCAAIRKEEAQSQENLLIAAGFKARPADTPAKLAQLKALPPLKMEVRQKNGKLGYSYADPYSCKCLYIGGPVQYQEYKRLAVKQQIAMENVEAAEAQEDAALDWDTWGGFGFWGP